MSGQGNCSHAFTVDLSNRVFRAMIFIGLSKWQVLSKMLFEFGHIMFWGNVSGKLHCDQMVQRISVWTDRRWTTTTVGVAR